MKAIMELKSIAQHADPITKERLLSWIKNNIMETSIDIQLWHPSEPKHAEYNIKSAKCKLGEAIADKANLFPKFIETKDGYECRLAAHYFKNEYGL